MKLRKAFLASNTFVLTSGRVLRNDAFSHVVDVHVVSDLVVTNYQYVVDCGVSMKRGIRP